MKTILKITAGILLAGCVMIGGCVALVGGAASEVDNQMQKEANRSAITKVQLASVKMGDSKKSVITTLGKPDDSQHMETSTEFGDSTSDCIYYNVKGKDWSDLDMHQLCFDDGKLTSKNRY
jgi:hypothetical protein